MRLILPQVNILNETKPQPVWITGSKQQTTDTRVAFSLAVVRGPLGGGVLIVPLVSGVVSQDPDLIPGEFRRLLLTALKHFEGEPMNGVTLRRIADTINSLASHTSLFELERAFVVERGSALYETLLPTFS